MFNSIVVQPKKNKPDIAVIWLHGLGANGNDFAQIVPKLILTNHNVKFIFPHAKSRPVTINHGIVMPAWYDIYSFDFSNDDTQGMQDSAQRIINIINVLQQEGITHNKIFLAGFSQGGAVALCTGLQHPALAGIIALSTYLPMRNKLNTILTSNTSKIEIFWGHGLQDTVVPFGIGQQSIKFLQQFRDINIDFNSYNIAHSVCDEEIIKIGTWMCERIKV